jgi:phosphoglycolate phosphatase/putative hydrolase of the HAD superfamily
MQEGCWDGKNIKAVLFDVDGTLYDQSRMRWIMIGQISLHCLKRARNLKILKVIAGFRRLREELAGKELVDLGQEQYRLCAERVNVSPERVKQIIEEWVYNRPLPFMQKCLYPHVK